MCHFLTISVLIWVQFIAFASNIDSLYKVTIAGKDIDKANAFYELSKALKYEKPERSVDYAQKGLNLAYQNNLMELQAKLHYQLGVNYSLIPDYEKAIGDLKKGYTLAQDLNDIKLCGDNAYHLGKIYYYVNETQTGIEYARQAIKHYQAIESLNNLADSYNLLALIYNASHQNSKGLEFLVKAVEVAEKTGNQKSLANIYVNIGNSFSIQGKPNKALEHYQKGLEIAQSIGYEKGISVALNNIGDIYMDKEDYQLAKSFFTRSIERDKTPYKKASAVAYNNIGKVYDKLGKPFMAEEYYQKSIEITKRTKNKSSRAATYINMAKMYHGLENYNKSLQYLKKAIHLGREIDDIYVSKDAEEYLAKNYEALNNYKAAHKSFKKYHQLEDSINQERQQSKIDELQLKYDIKQKEKTIDALMKKRTIDKLKMLNDKNRNTIINFVFIGIVALLIFLVFGAYLLYSRYTESKKANEKLTEKNNIIETQRNKILDSINYAKRIQDAILVPEEDIKRIIPNSFIYYEPRDIVSGDFYWINRIDQKIVVAAVDCTGHGVPGAFLTLIANMLLKRIVQERKETDPSRILEALDSGIIRTLQQNQSRSNSSDGMDISIVVIDEASQTLSYAGAMNPVYVVQSHQLTALQPNIVSIGGKAMRPGVIENKTFDTHTIPYTNDTSVYLLSDGYVDQFGGKKNSKFNTNRFKDLILNNYQKEMSEQKDLVHKTIKDWQGDQRQIDDILVIGLRL